MSTGHRAWLRHARAPLATALAIALLAASFPATAKTPGNTYCYKGICHRVKTLAETASAVGQTFTMRASFYDDPKRDRFNPRLLTSSGELFRPAAPDNAASPIFPDGTRLLVWYQSTGQALVVRVNNAGPYHPRRQIDLSRGAAEKPGFARQGVGTVQVRVLAAPTQQEARFRRGRTYDPVPGPLGVFASMEMALVDVGRAFGSMLAGSAGTNAGTQVASLTPTPTPAGPKQNVITIASKEKAPKLTTVAQRRLDARAKRIAIAKAKTGTTTKVAKASTTKIAKSDRAKSLGGKIQTATRKGKSDSVAEIRRSNITR